MQAERTAAPFEEDDLYEQEVLRHVLNAQPTILRLCDLIREIGSRDAVERAVRELVKVGLLHRQGEVILPTPAAVYVRGMEIG